MTVSYEIGGASNKDQVRLLIFDTDVGEGNAIFQDEEINRILIMQESSVFLAAANCLASVALPTPRGPANNSVCGSRRSATMRRRVAATR